MKKITTFVKMVALMAAGMVLPVMAQGKEFYLQKADVHDRMVTIALSMLPCAPCRS